MLRPFGGGTKATVPAEPPRHPVTGGGGGLGYCPPDAPGAGVQVGGSGVVPPLSASPCPRGGPTRPPPLHPWDPAGGAALGGKREVGN